MKLFLAAVALAGLVGVAAHHGTVAGPQGGGDVVGVKTSGGVTVLPVVAKPAAPSKSGTVPLW